MMLFRTIGLWLALTGYVLAFDHGHQQWDKLLSSGVIELSQGSATQVDYDFFKAESSQLSGYLAELSQVTQSEFDQWSADQQLAFLINAYNAFTIELILTRYPDLESIKDLGSWLQSPWKKRFFNLLGQSRTLDELEHQLIRGHFNEPRIHFAVNCASIGCPALATHAYTGSQLEQQLDSAARLFLKDASRNHYLQERQQLRVSKIFDWYGGDFVKAAGSVNAYLADYAKELQATPEQIRQAKLRFNKYDWGLNRN